MTQLASMNRHQRRAHAAQQRRSPILGANGLPAGQAPQIAMPGQHQIGMSFGVGPMGVAIVFALAGGQVLTIPMPPDVADEAGCNLIRLAHQFRLLQVADQAEGEKTDNPEAEALLSEFLDRANEREKTDASDQDQSEGPGEGPGPAIRLGPDRGPDHPHAGAIRGPAEGDGGADRHDPAG